MRSQIDYQKESLKGGAELQQHDANDGALVVKLGDPQRRD